MPAKLSPGIKVLSVTDNAPEGVTPINKFQMLFPLAQIGLLIFGTVRNAIQG